ncbi:MAG: serine/threonine protein kinase, partial [Actinomycetota bacterium]|nr:serine/threonine protein kinase [Actinomycetota bacterium]
MSEQPPDQATAALPTPQQRTVAGRYRLLELCGRGGTAEVWRALDEALGRVVAVKLVTVPTDEGAQRAGEEARLLARLSHPSLVPVYDAGTDADDRPWVVMELVQGETLGDTVRRGPLHPGRAATVGAAVAEALAYVHAQGLVHRDVKPGNVLVGDDGRVRLTDFGIARLVDAAKVTATGMTVGTASYLSPEQVLGERVTAAADVYALGLVLLECLTGRREYAGAAVEVALARLSRPPAVPPDLPSGWPGLLAAMTAREPAVRPSAAEVAQELRRIAAGGQGTTALQTVPAAERTQVLQQTRV